MKIKIVLTTVFLCNISALLASQEAQPPKLGISHSDGALTPPRKKRSEKFVMVEMPKDHAADQAHTAKREAPQYMSKKDLATLIGLQQFIEEAEERFERASQADNA